jgi:hypothetical protein
VSSLPFGSSIEEQEIRLIDACRDGSLLARMYSEDGNRYFLVHPELGMHDLSVEMPTGYYYQLSGLSDSESAYGFYGDTSGPRAGAVIVQASESAYKLYPLRQCLREEGTYAKLDSLICEGDLLLCNYSHQCCFQEDFCIYNLSTNHFTHPEATETPRLMSRMNALGEAFGDLMVQDSAGHRSYNSIYCNSLLELSPIQGAATLRLSFSSASTAGAVGTAKSLFPGRQDWTGAMGLIQLNDCVDWPEGKEKDLIQALAINDSGQILVRSRAEEDGATELGILSISVE